MIYLHKHLIDYPIKIVGYLVESLTDERKYLITPEEFESEYIINNNAGTWGNNEVKL